MDFILKNKPEIAVKIFSQLKNADLCRCRRVGKKWRSFIDNEKFCYINLTKNEPGWKKTFSELDSKAAKVYIKTYFKLRKLRDIMYQGLDVPDSLTPRNLPKIYKPCHPLFCSIDLNDLEMVKKLLNEFPNHQEFKLEAGFTPLTYAVHKGNLEIIQAFLDKTDGDKNPFDKRGRTPLHEAVWEGHFEVVKLLLSVIQGDKNPRDRQERKTPLHEATRHGKIKISKLLLQHVEGRDSDKETRHKDRCLVFCKINGYIDELSPSYCL